MNDPTGRAEFETTIATLVTLRKGLTNLQKAAVDFPVGEVGEDNLAKVLKEIGAPFREFWKKNGAKHIDNAVTMGLVCGGFTLASLVGIPVPFAAVFSGAVFAHKPISEVLKASKGLFNILGSS